MKKLCYFLVASLTLVSCNKDIEEEPIDQSKSLENAEEAILTTTGADVFNRTFSIQNDKGEWVKINSQQVKSFMSGEMAGSKTILDLTDFKLYQNPLDETEFAISATSTDGTTKISARLNLVGESFAFSGLTCECSSKSGSGCDPSFFGDGCRCSPSFPSNAGECTKKGTLTKPTVLQ